MAQISDRVNRLAASATFAMLQKSNELSAQGVDVVNMSVGEPDFNTPDYVKKAAVEAVEQNYSKYSPVPGYMWLRKACADKLKRENGLDYAPAEILVSTGAKQSLCNVIMAIINPGDEVLLPSPCWVSYPEMVKLAGGVPVVIKAGIDQDFKVTAAQVEAAITPKTKAIMICSPSNPTGSVYTKEELESIAKVLNKYPDVFIVSDEIYEHINFIGGHQSLAQFVDKDRIAVINGVSKAYAMTGWRIGFMAGPEWQDDVEKMRQVFQKRRDLIVSLAKEIPGFEVNNPQGAFYLFPKCDSYFGKRYGDKVINSAEDLAMYLLEVGHVATVGGTAFGSPECIRFSYATSEDKIVEAFRRVKEALAALK